MIKSYEEYREVVDSRLTTLKNSEVLVKYWNFTLRRSSYHSHLGMFLAAPFSTEGIPEGINRFCSATFEQRLALSATFYTASNLKQLLPSLATFF